MRVYQADKGQFLEDVGRNVIEERVLEALQASGIGGVSPREIDAFQQSLTYMKNVLEPPSIPADASVAIEYRIPQTAKRIDFILSGYDEQDQASCVIVELKQWQEVEPTDKDGIVRTFLGGARREVPHPSYQAWSYAALLEDFNAAVQETPIRLRPCAYLHNCKDPTLQDPRYREHLAGAPAFLRSQVGDLQGYIERYVRQGDQHQVLNRLEQSRIRPSRELADTLARLMRGNREFVMIDDQKVTYEAALEVAELGRRNGKQVLIVEGGPGTGKSVVAMNLLVELIQRGHGAQFVTRNRAPREVYKARLKGTLQVKRIDSLFRGTGGFVGSRRDGLDTLIIDEAHRIVERDRYAGAAGENQVKEMIRAARASVFFIDPAQQVTWQDIGSIDEIEHWAAEQGATVHRAVLQSQFRCNGSDGYLAWLDRALQIRDTAQEDLTGLDYHLEVVDDPNELRDRIRAHDAAGQRARLVAGYCWDWASKQDREACDIVLPQGFAMQWNLADDGPLYLEKAGSVDQVGCIHTVQGLELDLVGVIIGPDLVVRNGRVITQPDARARTDRSLAGYKTARKEAPAEAEARADAIIKNTYRTLMSRGLKGCLIYCTDPETQDYFREQVARAMASQGDGAEAQSLASGAEARAEVAAAEPQPSAEEPGIVRLRPRAELGPEDRAVPFVDLPAAAGRFAGYELAAGLEGGAGLSSFETWAVLPEPFEAKPGYFVARVEGESMSRRIPNGAYCLFQANPGGTRNGRVVLVHHRDIQDPDHGGALTVKVYWSEKVDDPETGWRHGRITLACDTLEAGYEDIVLEEEALEDLKVVGVLVAVLSY
ncbi:DNA/RNA helicase domain-containing protein [Halorhodospira neutriphila]|uniref:AAA family ATPase n=1 Tax=Halorhodospira neutriphila TaxID=168379 RepID=A0ABS1E2Y6_9GAMM|nr:DNA/RNA helicase domain-containing protein [Halorhodospira neutriphila]MBK1725599.1 AAA family ATPase [Halorhodospira neutriphila]